MAVTDLTDVGGITRSERCYSPDMTEKVALKKLLMPASGEQFFKEKEWLAREKKDKEALKGTSKPLAEKKHVNFWSSLNIVNKMLLNN